MKNILRPPTLNPTSLSIKRLVWAWVCHVPKRPTSSEVGPLEGDWVTEVLSSLVGSSTQDSKLNVLMGKGRPGRDSASLAHPLWLLPDHHDQLISSVGPFDHSFSTLSPANYAPNPLKTTYPGTTLFYSVHACILSPY